jgi:hypothetical protein
MMGLRLPWLGALALWLALVSRSMAQQAPAPQPADQLARAQAARRSAWQRLAHQVKRPSDIPALARQELRVHARRVARLARVRALAATTNDQAIVQRADKLLEREQTRHRAALTRVWPASADGRATTAPDEEPTDRSGRAHEEEDDAEGEP